MACNFPPTSSCFPSVSLQVQNGEQDVGCSIFDACLAWHTYPLLQVQNGEQYLQCSILDDCFVLHTHYLQVPGGFSIFLEVQNGKQDIRCSIFGVCFARPSSYAYAYKQAKDSPRRRQQRRHHVENKICSAAFWMIALCCLHITYQFLVSSNFSGAAEWETRY